MHHHGKQGDLEKMTELLEEMRAFKIKPNQIIKNHFLLAYITNQET